MEVTCFYGGFLQKKEEDHSNRSGISGNKMGYEGHCNGSTKRNHVIHLWDAVDLHGREFATLINQYLGEKTVAVIALPACH